jgi:hypothetical protein
MISWTFAACNLFNKAHDASSQLGVCESHECLHEREPVTRGRKSDAYAGKGALLCALGWPGAPSKKNGIGT